MQKQLTLQEVQDITKDIKFKDWKLKIHEYTDGFCLQWIFMEKDTTKPDDPTLYEQHCRKWFISKYYTVTEIIRTAWLAAQQAVIHEAAESFMYKDSRLFDPHTDYVALSFYMKDAKQDIRE